MLALVPLLLLTPPVAIPLLVVGAHVAAIGVHAAAGGREPVLIPIGAADAAYALAPALVFALAPADLGRRG